MKRKYDENGYARSTIKGIKYLLHEDGTRLRFASLRSELNEDIEAVILEEKGLKALPIKLFECKKLKLLTIKIGGNFNLAARIGELKHLEILNLELTNVTVFPVEICYLKNLKILKLLGRFTHIPVEIGHLTNLTLLYLKGDFTQIPPEIGHLTNLTVLELHNWDSDNAIHIPLEIEHLTNLGILFLQNVATLPDEIWHLTQLQILYLTNNKLTNISLEIINLIELKYLGLHGGSVQNINQIKWLIPACEILL